MRTIKIILIVFLFVFLSTSVVSADTVNYSDTTRPVIESITLNPSIVNVSEAGAVLIATIVASDDLNTMNSFNGYIDPFYGANPQSNGDAALSTKVVNGRIQVTFQLKYVFKKGTPVGAYQIRATVYDAADNRLVAAGANMPGNSFKVINDVAAGPIDVTQYDYSTKLQLNSEQIQSLTADLATSKKKITQLEQTNAELVQDVNSELVTSKSKISNLEKQLENLNSSLAATKANNDADTSAANTQMQALLTKFNSLDKKLKNICSKKPKPKGC